VASAMPPFRHCSFHIEEAEKKLFVHSHALRFQTYVLEMNTEKDILTKKTTSIPRRLA
jgi:hypothetical protein